MKWEGNEGIIVFSLVLLVYTIKVILGEGS